MDFVMEKVENRTNNNPPTTDETKDEFYSLLGSEGHIISSLFFPNDIRITSNCEQRTTTKTTTMTKMMMMTMMIHPSTFQTTTFLSLPTASKGSRACHESPRQDGCEVENTVAPF